jgi:hypothetical protein
MGRFPSQGHLSQGIGGLILLAWYVIELEAFELGFEFVDLLVVGYHPLVNVARFFHDLVDHEL